MAEQWAIRCSLARPNLELSDLPIQLTMFRLFVDTPGFDDTNRTDIESLTVIADFLKKKSVIALKGSHRN